MRQKVETNQKGSTMHLAVVVLPEGNSILMGSSKSELLQEIQGELDILMPEQGFDLAVLDVPGVVMADLDGIQVFLSEDKEARIGKTDVTHAILVRRLDETRSFLAKSENDLMVNSGKIMASWGETTRRLNPSEDVSVLLGSINGNQRLRDIYLERQASRIVTLPVQGRIESLPEALCA